MNRKKFSVAGIIVIIALAVVLILNIKARHDNAVFKMPSQMTLFYSKYCPHCARVEKYLTTNHVKQKIPYLNKEVSSNQPNAQLLYAVVQHCLQPTDRIAVPLLWTGNRCITGDLPIINYFKKRLQGMKNAKIHR